MKSTIKKGVIFWDIRALWNVSAARACTLVEDGFRNRVLDLVWDPLTGTTFHEGVAYNIALEKINT